MKKRVALVLVFALVFLLTGCGKKSSDSIPSKELMVSYYQNKGEAYAVKQLQGCGSSQLIEAWDEPDSSLSGFWGDIWKTNNRYSLIVYYNSNGIVEQVKAADEAANDDSSSVSTAKYDWGLTLSVKNAAPTGAVLVITQSGGNIKGKLQYGAPYKIQAFDEGVWEDAAFITEGEPTWIMVAYTVDKESSTEIELSWENLYGSLPAGQYRIVKTFTNFYNSDSCDKESYYAEFEIN